MHIVLKADAITQMRHAAETAMRKGDNRDANSVCRDQRVDRVVDVIVQVSGHHIIRMSMNISVITRMIVNERQRNLRAGRGRRASCVEFNRTSQRTVREC